MSRRVWVGYAVAGLLGAVSLFGAWRWGGLPLPSSLANALPDETAHIDVIREAYGPPNYSQGEEETLIRAFFQDRRGGFFLDVGASHYEKDSTTYYLEKDLGWYGIAIDALEEFREGYELNRKRTRFFAFFVTNEVERQRDFYVYSRDTRISSGSLEQLRGLPRVKDRYIEKTQVPSITLNHLLDAHGVDRVDFVSMDIEGSEPEALQGFDIERYRPELVCIETQAYTFDRLLAYFASRGYGLIEPYRSVDQVNLYFRLQS